MNVTTQDRVAELLTRARRARVAYLRVRNDRGHTEDDHLGYAVAQLVDALDAEDEHGAAPWVAEVLLGPAPSGDLVWPSGLVRDVTTAVLRSLLTSGVLRECADPAEVRVAVAAALAAAGIREGAVR